MQSEKEKQILETISKKSKLKQHVFDNTLNVLNMMKDVLQEMAISYNSNLKETFNRNVVVYKDLSNFQAELKVAGDILVFKMHSNVFEFDREHGVWKISYVMNNELSTYSGIISIYNFLADSFTYNRTEDLGYLIGRIFINKDLHYFVEGKRQMGFLYNDFGNSVITKEGLKSIIETAVAYALEFDLLVPPYDDVKIISVEQIQESRINSQLKTGKRLGFTFRSDDVRGDSNIYTGG